MSKEQAKREIELLLMGIIGVKEMSNQAFESHLNKVKLTLEEIIDRLDQNA